MLGPRYYPIWATSGSDLGQFSPNIWTPPLLAWISSYLGDRKQKVVINGLSSESKDINASVPQGSILGPLLFLCYVNDIVNDLETLPNLFADDISLFCTIDPKYPNVAFDKVNRDLTKLSDWANQWMVTFNATNPD